VDGVVIAEMESYCYGGVASQNDDMLKDEIFSEIDNSLELIR
jgi:hypothetical protein